MTLRPSWVLDGGTEINSSLSMLMLPVVCKDAETGADEDAAVDASVEVEEAGAGVGVGGRGFASGSSAFSG